MHDNPILDGQLVPATQTPPLTPAIIVIFGITGDLAKRYLLPALYRLFKDGLLPDKTSIVGISRRPLVLDDIFRDVELCVSEQDKICDPATLERMRSHTRPYQLDMTNPEAYTGLLQALNDIETEQGTCLNRLYYLSIPPAAYEETISLMAQAGLNGSCQHNKAASRLLVEKPFGLDLASAEQLIKSTGQAFPEEQVYRIDHYLAKETAQNIVTFRFENPLFEAIWNKDHVSKIDIVASEEIGVEGRANFYEGQGALRDFVQNHLLQLLAISTMDRPEQYDSQSIHATKLKLLQAIRPADPVKAKRGQYEGYRQEVNNPESHVETFAAIQTSIDSERWQGVPITIRTGKALADKRSTVTFSFKSQEGRSNDLQFRIQPDEGIALHLLAKKPGFDQELQNVAMDFSYAQNFSGPHPSAYERVLLDAVRGDRSLFATGPEVLAAWRVVDPVVQAWQASDDGLESYQPGTPIDNI